MIGETGTQPCGSTTRGQTQKRTATGVACLAVPVVIAAALISLAPPATSNISDLLRGNDDVMRMVQIVDWLDGQAWTNVTQERLNPPDGVTMHWSRLADLPTAAATALLDPWVGRARALYLSALLVPPLLGGLLAGTFLWTGRMMTRTPDSLATALMSTTPVFAYLLAFPPGRIDHHGLQILLATLATGLCLQTLTSAGRHWAPALGITSGTSLAIGLETLPFIGAMSAALAFGWATRAGTPASALAVFGISVTTTALALMALTLPAAEWTAPACDRLSIVHLAVMTAIALAGATALLTERVQPQAPRRTRIASVGITAIGGVALALIAFPDCAGSPYANLSGELRYWLDKVTEARSLLETLKQQPVFALSVVATPAAALTMLALQARQQHRQPDPRWIAATMLVVSSIALTGWQIRSGGYAAVFASLALVPWASAANKHAGELTSMWAKSITRLIVPLACIAAFALPQLVAKPVPKTGGEPSGSECDTKASIAALTHPDKLGRKPRTIAAPIELGPEILLLTRHQVLAAPYHRNARGLGDNRLIFAGTEKQALETIRSRNVDTILFCQQYTHVTAFGHQPGFLNERLTQDKPPRWLATVVDGEHVGLYTIHTPDTHHQK